MAASDATVPGRVAVEWRDSSWLDPAALEAETRRVFEVCSNCRRCEMLCDSFPRLFDLADRGPDEIASAPFARFAPVADACTLCDMCYPVCPYVPPHAYAVDFPSLMVRSRAREAKAGRTGRVAKELRKTDRNGRLMTSVAPIVNWASRPGNPLTRPILQWTAGIHRDSELPRAHSATFSRQAKESPAEPAAGGPSAGARPSSTPPASSSITTRPSGSRRARCSRRTGSRPGSPIRSAAACRSSRKATWQT